jgi:WD40 repeat protein
LFDFGRYLNPPRSLVSEAQHSIAPFKVELVAKLPMPGGAVAVAWSPDGSRLVAAGAYGVSAAVWSALGKKLSQFNFPANGPVLNGSIGFVSGESQILFSAPNGKGASKALGIWDASSGKLNGLVAGLGVDERLGVTRVDYFAISQGQDLLATVSSNGLALNFYRGKDLSPLHGISVGSGVHCLNIFGRDRFVAVGLERGAINIYDIDSGTAIKQIQAYEPSQYGFLAVEAVAGNPRGDVVFSGSGAITLVGNPIDSEAVHAWENSIEPAHLIRVADGGAIASLKDVTPPIRKAEWDPLGRYIAFIDAAGFLILWDVEQPQKYIKVKLSSDSMSLAISPDGSRVAVAKNDGIGIFSVK